MEEFQIASELFKAHANQLFDFMAEKLSDCIGRFGNRSAFDITALKSAALPDFELRNRIQWADGSINWGGPFRAGRCLPQLLQLWDSKYLAVPRSSCATPCGSACSSL